MQFYVPCQLSNAPWDKYEKIKCACGATAGAGDKIRYHDSKKVISKTNQAYHIISERIITHTSQNKRYDGIRKG